MASRRVRIKGLANIPQRRKTEITPSNEDTPKPVPEIAQQTCDQKPNPTSTSDTTCVKVETSAGDPATIRFPLVINEIKKETDPPKVLDIVDNNNKERKPSTIQGRRKFIKPAVSLNAISRKNKDIDDLKVADKNKRIVVLSQVVTHPNQTQEIIINKDNGLVYTNLDSCSTEEGVAAIGLGSPRGSYLEELKKPYPTQPVENEYPAPPPSPSKINRSRIKAVPRLGQRHTSFSASESEDETRKNYRHRNDSVCSTTSGMQDSIPDCPSPQKPKEFNTVIQRKCRRTEQSRKLAEARRDFYLKFGNNKPDRQKLTMIDLIFYNPTTNPMPHDIKSKPEFSEENTKNDVTVETVNENEENVDDPAKSGSDEENDVPAPQIKIGPQGEFIVDEQSLVIESKALKKNREELQKSAVVNGDFNTGYGIYKRAKRAKDWNREETLKFYKALNTIGTDFTLMCDLFPRRSRRELKMKFKKEERINKNLIDKAIMQPCGFDFEDFRHEVEMEEKEREEQEKQKEKEAEMRMQRKRKNSLPAKDEIQDKAEQPTAAPKPAKKKKKALDIMNVLDDDSDSDESSRSFLIEEEENEDLVLEKMRQRPTRSGRVPKILDRYRAPPMKSEPTKNEPGSLMVFTSSGPDGAPVYNVYMITEEQNRQQIGKDLSSFSEALAFKEKCTMKSIFTLTTSNGVESDKISEIPPENNVTISAECNVTIPADEK